MLVRGVMVRMAGRCGRFGGYLDDIIAFTRAFTSFVPFEREFRALNIHPSASVTSFPMSWRRSFQSSSSMLFAKRSKKEKRKGKTSASSMDDEEEDNEDDGDYDDLDGAPKLPDLRHLESRMSKRIDFLGREYVPLKG